MMFDEKSIDLGGLWLDEATKAGRSQTLYLQKLGRQSDWGHETDPIDTRVESAVAAVFRPDDSAFSLYQIGSYPELSSVIAGLPANREKPRQNIDVIVFTHAELVSAGITVLSDVPGELGCVAANRLHVDIESDNRDSYATLCRQAMSGGRTVRRFKKKSEVSQIVSAQEAYGCEAFAGNGNCPCH
ncbi:hypothetical protein [Allorhodopirellula solitaria]|uniref:Uncharacterized protein n=1 Tax=Allorhodopirellula solitaria TaxID=2527987 RepID=A0A5C5X1B7_9BACT|nr:hypothetical protein [Allorhodopirellula solitaria]TWT56590.1 hypothetical protein CA85_41240 [Allorhodopirellula solitaria]